MTKFYGKYRGKVTNNVDLEQLGRIQVSVPAVLGSGRLSWAMPSVPYAGMGASFFAIPPVNANVWVEFEGGNLEHPIWSGCFWGIGETPPLALVPPPTIPHIHLQTSQLGLNSVTISDAPGPTGGIILKTKSGAMILINDTGITLSNGKGATILMTGKAVIINEGALVIQ